MGFTSQEYVLPVPFSPGTDPAEKERAGWAALERLEDSQSHITSASKKPPQSRHFGAE